MVAVTASRLLSSTLSVASLMFLYSVTNSRVLALHLSLAERVHFFNISVHADGERRGPAPIWRYPKTRLTETFLVPPFRFDLAPIGAPPKFLSKSRSALARQRCC